MKCILCKGKTIVIDSRSSNDFAVRRRRHCLKCKLRFTTSESVIDSKGKIVRPKRKKKADAYKEIKAIEESYFGQDVFLGEKW